MAHRWSSYKPRFHPTTQIFYEDLGPMGRPSAIRFIGFEHNGNSPSDIAH